MAESYRIRTWREEPGSVFVPVLCAGPVERPVSPAVTFLSFSLFVRRLFTFSSFFSFSFFFFWFFYVLYSNTGNLWHGVPPTRRKACRELAARRKCSVKIGDAVAIVAAVERGRLRVRRLGF